MHPVARALLERCRRAKARWIEPFGYPARQQRELLLTFVRDNADTVFGREHGFSHVTDENSFRRAVPPRSYEELAPWIERAAAGEARVLTAEPPVWFNRTSGSTQSSKMIPITESYDSGPMNQRLLVSLANILEHHEEVLESHSSVLSFLTPQLAKETERTKGGMIYASASSRAGRDPHPDRIGWPGARQTIWSRMPPSVTTLEELNYYRLRSTVEVDLKGMFTINPSTLVVFAQQIEPSLPRLLEELRQGVVSGVPRYPPNPRRAAEIEEMVRQRGTLRPVDLWPRLRVIWSWKAASCALYLPAVRAAYGEHVDIMAWPTVSSEVSLSVPVDHEDDAPMALPMAFFEFLDPDEEPTAGSHTLLCEELEVGRSYQVIVTQACGLYRYRTEDIVRVTGWVGKTPRVEFVGRRGANSSFTGEKLTEHQVEAAIQDAVASLGGPVTGATCCPVWDDPPYYALAIEPTTPLSDEQRARLAKAFDHALGVHNDEYPSKRGSNRLGPAVAHVLRPGTFGRHRALRIERGEPPAQMKDRGLQRDQSVLTDLLQLSLGAELRAPQK